MERSLLQGFDCACGRRHECPVDLAVVESGAANRLEEVFPEKKSFLVVADENTFAAAGQMTLDALRNKTTRTVVFPGERILVPNETAAAAVEAALEGVDALIAVGSGVIQDLCKYVSFRNSLPYAVVATAPSMDGYASDGAAMILNGMKVTVKAGLPRAILADPAVLKKAPMDMIRAGYGDVVGKYSALNDWRLAACVNSEYFCPWIYDRTMEEVERVIALSDGLLRRDEGAVAALMEALITVGVMMSFAGSSRPASGAEHHLSHFFEITGILENKPYLPHGIDVAYSTVVTARLREKILSRPFPRRRCRLSEDAMAREMRRVYASLADSCRALQKKAGHYAADRTGIYLAKEEELRTILRETPGADQIEAILKKAGFDEKEFTDAYGEAKIRDAVKWAKDLKDRYTVLWINFDLYEGEMA